MESRRFRGAATLWIICVLMLPETQARAGGFSIPLIGGRGSTKFAFVARPDDTSAIYHNPAGLSLLGPYQIDLTGIGILSYSRYTRCLTTTFDPSGNSTGCGLGGGGEILYAPSVETTKYGSYPRGFGILPYMGLSGRFGLKKWNFGLAVYSPQNATGSFPDCQRDSSGAPVNCDGAPQRFHAMLGSINTIYISPTASFEPHPAISLGLGVAAVRASITLDRSLWLGGPDSTVAVLDQGWGGEGTVHLSADTWSWAFTLGAIWNLGETFAPGNRLLRGLRFGISYSSQTQFKFKDKMSLYSPLLYSFVEENDGCSRGSQERSEVRCSATSTFTFPMQVRFGLDWELSDEWDVAMDVFWQNYSVYKEIRISFPTALSLVIPGRDPVTVDGTAEPKDSKDIWSVAVGGQYSPRWARGLEFRAGVMWDQSPYPNRTYTLLNPDADKIGVGIGVGYRFPFGLEIAAGYVGLFYSDRIVRDSEIRPRICRPDDADCQAVAPDADFTMNGDVKDKIVHLFVLHLGWRFGGGKPPLEGRPPLDARKAAPEPEPAPDSKTSATPHGSRPSPPAPVAAPPRAKPSPGPTTPPARKSPAAERPAQPAPSVQP
ncbi:MAG: outer membrane protein transport protein [Polyangia bacterium]|jgi:long-chain fatty acid transport protein|nr:outer membrane protein transport protein [Polyangia bacterium]